MTDTSSRPPAAQRSSWVVPLACACFAFLTHTLPFVGRVFLPFGLVLYGDGDVYYHLRRIRAIAAHWPQVTDFDPYMNYPDGAYSIWAPGFDFVPATVAQLGLPVETLAVYWPALLGALACLPCYAYCTRRFGASAAIGVNLSFAVLPAAVLIGALGRIDHHVAELLFQLLIYAQLERCCSAYDAGAKAERADWIWLGLSMGGALLTWAGSLLFLCVPAALGVALNVLAPGPSTQRCSRVICAAFMVAALIALPYGVLNCVRGRELFSPNFPSLLQSIACLLMSVVVHSAARMRQVDPLQRVIIAAVPCALLCLPGVARGLRQGLAFLSRDQTAWLTTISEFQPLLSSLETLHSGTRGVGYAFFLIPVAVAWNALLLLRQRRCNASELLLLAWSSQVFVLTLLQIRFLHYAAPVVAMLPWWLYQLCRLQLQDRHARAAAHAALDTSAPTTAASGSVATAVCGTGATRAAGAVSAAVAALPVLLLWPIGAYYAPLLQGGAPAYPQFRADLFELLHSLPQHTPAVEDPQNPAAKPAYCVFAEWELGHLIVELAKRPVVANNFGSHLEGTSYEDSRYFFEVALDEAQALAALERRGCRYVLTPARSPLVAATVPAGFARRVHDADGSDAALGGGSGRLRLVRETFGPVVSGQPAYKLFELVRGARLTVGSASPELWVETHIKSSRRDFWYRRKLTRALDQATLETRLAYPGAYRLVRDNEAVFGVNVTSEAVLQGRTITLSER